MKEAIADALQFLRQRLVDRARMTPSPAAAIGLGEVDELLAQVKAGRWKPSTSVHTGNCLTCGCEACEDPLCKAMQLAAEVRALGFECEVKKRVDMKRIVELDDPTEPTTPEQRAAAEPWFHDMKRATARAEAVLDDPKPPPTKDERIADYQQAVMACAIAAKVLALHDIPKLLEKMEQADALGPLLHPSLWMQKRKALEEDRELLKAAHPLWAFAKKVQAAAP